MNITEEALDEIEADAKYGAYVAPGTAVELIEEIRSLRADNTILLAVLERAKQDINWMLNSGQMLNGHVFDYIDAAITRARGEK